MSDRPLNRCPPAPPVWPPAPVGLPVWDGACPPRHVHVVPSLSLGGAERIVVDLAATLSDGGAEADVAMMRQAEFEHPLAAPGIVVHRLGGLSWPERAACAAGLALASRLPAFCHLTSFSELTGLWRHGVQTVPVVHNVRAGWKEDPCAWNGAALVPFVVACGKQVAAELHAAGLRKPVRVLRHLVAPSDAMPPARRTVVRAALGAGPGTLLMGMAGRHVRQKHHVKAVQVLARMVRDGVDARLVVVGAATGGEGERCRAEAAALAQRLGVRGRLVLVGPVADAAGLVRAYDVFLNTSLWEGVSVATMEAEAAGVPVVCSDVGGQREAVGPQATLLPSDAPDAAWANAVRAAASRGPVAKPADGRHEAVRRMAATRWPWLLALGPGAVPPTRRGRQCDVLFVTGNLDVGGAQRSLCNLLAAWPVPDRPPVVAVCGPVGVPGLMDGALKAGVAFLDLSGASGQVDGLRGRAGRVLGLVQALRPRTVCFWNMDALTKLAVAAILSGGPVRVADVSPGPMLYAEMEAARDDARLLGTSPEAYFDGLDMLVSKYGGEKPPGGRRRHVVIPNGVPRPGPLLPPGDGPSPPGGADPALAVVSVGRLVPAKRPRLLPLVARALGARLPGATLTVVAGVHGSASGDVWSSVLAACGGALPGNLHFAGPDHRTTGFLPRFAAFYMVSTGQGCPNASLEAMACGLPVVANPDGGTAEQVVDGVTGRLVSDPGCEVEYAERLAEALSSLLADPPRAAAMGAAARSHVQTRFSMAAMAEAYRLALLE